MVPQDRALRDVSQGGVVLLAAAACLVGLFPAAGNEEPVVFEAKLRIHSWFSVCSVVWWCFGFILSGMRFKSMLMTFRVFPSTIFCWKSTQSAICGARPGTWKGFVSQLRSRFEECAGGWA